MAGGQGTRLRPLTSNQPKPMLPIANRPIMEHIIGLLRRHGVQESVATIQFLGRLIRWYFGNGEDHGVHISYATEETPLGTAGSVKNAQEELEGGTFIVISGDALTDIDLTKLVEFHRMKSALATVCLKSVENPLEFGIVITREDGAIERFLEKPNWGQVFSDTINTGIYVLEPEIFEYIPAETVFDFSHDLFPVLLDKGLPLFGYVADGYWCDVGHFDSYLKAHQDVLDGRVDVEIPGFSIGRGIWLGEGAEVDPEARLDGPVVIGENSRVEAGAHLREFTVLGANVIVKEGAFLHRTVVHDNAYIGPMANLRGCVIGKNSDVRHAARLEEGVILGEDSSIGENAVINPGVRIYPFKTVEPGAIITKSIIWESRGARTLFGSQGVSGLINVDVTAELAVRLAMAYGSTLKKGSVVTASRDATRAARAMKRAVVAGLNMAGTHCHDLEHIPVPVSRYYIRVRRCEGGIAIRTSPGDPQSIRITFIDPDGTDLDEGAQRKIERTVYREEFRRAFAGELGELHYPPRALEYYTEGLLGAVDAHAIRSSRLKIVVDYAFGSTALVLPSILGQLGCEVLALNSAVDETRSVLLPQEVHAHQSRIADLVAASGSDFGALLDPTGERIFLIDDAGRVCDASAALTLVVSQLVSQHRKGAIALPVTASREIARLASAGDIDVVWTKTAPAALMDEAHGGEVVFAGSPEGALIFPEFLPAADAMMALTKFLEYRARMAQPLSEMMSPLPKAHIVHETVACAWELKGTVMRRVMEAASGDKVELVDGVKAYHDQDWVLVLPDPEQPLVHVWAEGSNEAAAGALAGTQVRLIRTLTE
jgi:mannose-1-phosphate guanylyltransferase/phosphomannomutase